MRIVAPIPKKSANKAKFSKNHFFLPGGFTPFMSKSLNLRPLLSITFPKGFRKSEKFGHWTLKRSEQMQKNWKKKNTYLMRQFYTLYKLNFSNLRSLLPITFSQGLQKSKNFGHWTFGSGGTKTGKRSEKHQYQNILLSKAKFAQKQTFFYGNLTPFIIKSFQM